MITEGDGRNISYEIITSDKVTYTMKFNRFMRYIDMYAVKKIHPELESWTLSNDKDDIVTVLIINEDSMMDILNHLENGMDMITAYLLIKL